MKNITNQDLKELIKEAVLEALMAFSNDGVAVTSDSGFEDGMKKMI